VVLGRPDRVETVLLGEDPELGVAAEHLLVGLVGEPVLEDEQDADVHG